MNRLLKGVVMFVLFVMSLTIGIYIGSSVSDESAAYFDISHVYAEFEMTKEYDKKLDSIKNVRRFILDSIRLQIDELKNKYELQPEAGLLVELKEKLMYYQEKDEFFSKDNNENERSFKEQIIKQFNSYVKDYGDQHQFDLIFGATDQGSIMYADKNLDVTKEVVLFINERYNDKSENLNP